MFQRRKDQPPKPRRGFLVGCIASYMGAAISCVLVYIVLWHFSAPTYDPNDFDWDNTTADASALTALIAINFGAPIGAALFVHFARAKAAIITLITTPLLADATWFSTFSIAPIVASPLAAYALAYWLRTSPLFRQI